MRFTARLSNAACLGLLLVFGPLTTQASPPHFTGELTPQSVIQFINERKIKNADELLSFLPQKLRHNFTLAHQSRSLHAACADKATPRVILYSPDDDFTLAVTGSLAQPDCGNIEMMKFDRKLRRFQFKEYRFDGGPERSCAECHGADARPIWFSYPKWPGFYGQDDDSLSEDERGDFLRRKAAWIDSPVYRRLDWGKRGSAYPFGDHPVQSITLRPNFRYGMLLGRENASRLARVYSESEGYGTYKYAIESLLVGCPLPDRSALNLGNSDANLRQFYYEGDLGPSAQSTAPLDALIPQVSVSLETRTPGMIFKPDWFALDRIKPEQLPPDEPSARFSDGFNDGELLVSALLARELLQDFARKSPEFTPYLKPTSVFDHYQNPVSALPSPEEQQDSEIFPAAQKSELLWIDQKGGALSLGGYPMQGFSRDDSLHSLCDQLLEKNKEALLAPHAGIPYRITRQTPPVAPTVGRAFSSCVACHDGSLAAAPKIRFDDLTALGRELKEGGYSHGTLADEIRWRVFVAPEGMRMPLYAPALSAGDLDSIRAFIDRAAGPKP